MFASMVTVSLLFMGPIVDEFVNMKASAFKML
jgi:hypothetical protein